VALRYVPMALAMRCIESISRSTRDKREETS
jgi:hypothetical protein